MAFVSGTADYPEASVKFLGNALRQEFGFDGVPLRIDIRMRKKAPGGKPVAGRRKLKKPVAPVKRRLVVA